MAEIMRVKDEITLAIEARDAGQRKAQLDLGLVPLWSVLPPGIVEVKAAAGGRSAKIVAVASLHRAGRCARDADGGLFDQRPAGSGDAPGGGEAMRGARPW